MVSLLNSYKIETAQILESLQKVKNELTLLGENQVEIHSNFRMASSESLENIISKISSTLNITLQIFQNQIRQLLTSISNSMRIDLKEVEATVSTIQRKVDLTDDQLAIIQENRNQDFQVSAQITEFRSSNDQPLAALSTHIADQRNRSFSNYYTKNSQLVASMLVSIIIEIHVSL
jgi:hypothetical protein